MLNVDLYNFIPVLTGKAQTPDPIKGDPKTAAKTIRRSCPNRGDDYDTWSALIREHCVIPSDHPFKKLLEDHAIPQEDPLWTLGSIAFGTETGWIVFNRLIWPDGKKAFPERLDLEWARKHSPKIGA